PAAARPDGAALPPTGGASDGAVRMPELPQGGELVLPGAEAGPGHPAADDDDRVAVALRGAGGADRRDHRDARRGRLARCGDQHPRARRADFALVRWTMSLDKAFLADVAEHPDDDAPRLVYADWLEDNGDPDRAEFIRVQVELARPRLRGGSKRRRELQKREKNLFDEHGTRWKEAVGAWCAEPLR